MPPFPAASPAASRSAPIAVDSLTSSFGTFKPVGHLVVGLPTQAEADLLVTVLHQAGWPAAALRHFTPHDGQAELSALIDGSGALAGFGYEITLLRRYLELARDGYRWLLVKVDSPEEAAAAGDFARRHGARLAVWYRTLTTEELI